MLYLVRHHEAGRDGQEGRRGQRRDLVAEVRAAVPDARISASPGRLVVESEQDAAPVLASLHGVLSFSPCRRVAVDELEAAAVALARDAVPARGSFAVRVKRGGAPGSSMALAARLGAAIVTALPDRRVDLDDPDVTLGVEVHDGDGFLFERAVVGIDHRGAPPAAPPCLAEPRFIADQMLGRLAAWLRLLGFDTLHPWDQPDSRILRTARAEARIILTRDRPLSQVRSVPVYFVQAEAIEDQLAEVVSAFRLVADDRRLFSRCPRCNRPVESVDKADVVDRIPPAVARLHESFRRCAPCGRVYWRGDHCARVVARLAAAGAVSPP